jgi:hypothetical protein
MREGDKEGIALSPLERFSQESAVLSKRFGVALTEVPEKLGGTFDVREEQSYRAAGTSGRHVDPFKRTAAPRGLLARSLCETQAPFRFT